MRVVPLLAGLVLLAALFLPAPRSPVDDPSPASSGATFGTLSLVPAADRAVVGFQADQFPAAGVGQTLAGLPVLSRIPQIHVLVLQAPDLAAARAALAAVPGISYIESDHLVQASAVPNDPHYPGQYGPALMGFPAAWGVAGYGSSNVKVAMIDSGILRTHPDLDSPRILAGHDYVNNDGTPNDDCGHGTHVSGTVAATTNNGIGVAGMSQATILPLKVLDSSCSGHFSNIAQAIVDATDQGVRVISLSLGGPSGDSATASAVAYAWDHGVLIVAAAGNTGSDAVQYPAAYPQVIAVSAVDSNANLASYSSWGSKVEVAAPGTGIDSTTNSGGYTTMSGTSMATPHVAGALALALSCAPTLTNADLRADLDASAQDLGVAGRDAKTGYGLARADLLVARTCGVQPVNHSPVALFTTSPAGLTVQFDGSSSHDADGDALSYAWAFGDGSAAGSGRTVSHTYAVPGAYTVALTVSDGRNATTTSASVPVTAPAFAATFTPASGCNAWWVEVRVASSRPVTAVFATVDGGPRVALPKTSWGDWAKSFYVAKGSAVQFGATDSDGDTVLSPVIPWLGAIDNAGAFTATITPRQTTNHWWVEVQVTSNHAVASVDARVGSGAWVSLPKDSWGTWAKSFYVAPGSAVTFRATDTAGATLTSATYVWS